MRTPGRGQVTHCDFWVPDVEAACLVWAGAQPANRLPVLTMVCGDGLGTAWTYVTGIDLPAQCSMELRGAGPVR